MPFSEQRYTELQHQIRLSLASSGLDEWQRGFLRDIQTKLNRTGHKTRLSDKQYRQLMKLTEGKGSGTSFEHRAERQRHRSRAFAGHKSQGNTGVGSGKIGVTGGVAAVGLVLTISTLFKAPERFPEYLGPVVAWMSVGSVSGPVTHVRDGDTIEVSGVPIRFGSLDCAESGTQDGRRATARVHELVQGETLICHLNGRVSYDRKIGSCRLSDGQDLAGLLIREGYCSRFW